MFRKFFLSVSYLAISLSAMAAEVGHDDMNKSNNPLSPMLGLNFQDYITSEIYGTDEDSNTLLLRGILPHKTGGLKQIARLTMPYVSLPGSRDNTDGFGDLNLFDIFLLDPVDGIEFGVGPYFVFPTASKDEAGAGLWQAGLSGVVMKPTSLGVFGGLLTYQHDFAGPSDRPTQSLLTLQPFANINLPIGFYFRSTGVWNFNLETDDYYIPVGAGLGKVFKFDSGNILNAYVEPQWTLSHEGDGQPKYQTFVGINMQFPF